MFTAVGLLEIHAAAHGSLALLLSHCRPFTPDELQREHAGFGFPTLHSQLRHMISCEDYWIAKLQDRGDVPHPRTMVQGEPLGTVELLEVMRERVAAATAGYLQRLGDAGVVAPVTMSWPADGGYSATRTPAFITMHLITHAFHHKGQAVAMCRLLGRPAPDTDLQRREA